MKRTIQFIEAQSRKDKALQTAIRAFAIIKYGGTLTPKDAKIFIDLCSLALPNKYRFPRVIWDQMEKQISESLHAIGIFIEAQSTKDMALQTAIRAFAIIRYGGNLSPEDAKVFIDLCSLALPMKYRFPQQLWEQMEKQITESLHAIGTQKHYEKKAKEFYHD